MHHVTTNIVTRVLQHMLTYCWCCTVTGFAHCAGCALGYTLNPLPPTHPPSRSLTHPTKPSSILAVMDLDQPSVQFSLHLLALCCFACPYSTGQGMPTGYPHAWSSTGPDQHMGSVTRLQNICLAGIQLAHSVRLLQRDYRGCSVLAGWRQLPAGPRSMGWCAVQSKAHPQRLHVSAAGLGHWVGRGEMPLSIG
jgi:hypothetical protein